MEKLREDTRTSVSKAFLFLIGILFVSGLPILEKIIFSFHDIIDVVISIWLRDAFRGNFYYWTKMIWWGSFVVSDKGLIDNIDQGITAYQSCIANHMSPDSNCREDVKDLVKIFIHNIIKGIVGWQTGYELNYFAENGYLIKTELVISTLLILIIASIWRLYSGII